MQQKLSKVQKTTGDTTDGTAWLLHLNEFYQATT